MAECWNDGGCNRAPPCLNFCRGTPIAAEREVARLREIVMAKDRLLERIDAVAGDMSHSATARCGDIGRLVRRALALPDAPKAST